jgi:hypothetical protein
VKLDSRVSWLMGEFDLTVEGARRALAGVRGEQLGEEFREHCERAGG